MKVRTIVAATVGAGLVLFLTAPTGAQTGSGAIMTGLDNPRGLTFVKSDDEDDGGFAVLVAEAGKGGAGPCAIIRGENQCAGTTGAVSRYWRGKQERVVTGLPSYAAPGGGGATGPHDVSFADDRGFVVIGLGGDPALVRATFGSHFGWTARFRPNGNVSFVADVSEFENTNPGGGPIDTNPYGLLEGAGGRIVVDAGGNTLLRVAGDGDISTIAVLESRAQGRPTDSSPTSVAFRRGAYYVGELTGGPFDAGVARIYRVVPGQAPAVYLEGFTLIIDIDFDRRGNLYVLEIGGAGLSPPGALIRVAPDGTRTTVPTPPLFFPSSVGIGPDGDAYISNCGVCAGGGEVIRVDLGGPSDDD